MKSEKGCSEDEATEYKKVRKKLSYVKDISNDDSKVDLCAISEIFSIVNWEYKFWGKMKIAEMEIVDVVEFTLCLWMVHQGNNMLVEKKYPLIKELLEKMLNLQLEAKEESTMAFELIKFIKSLLEE
ncbi:hypothetical protein Tco_0990203 [Tanacetum coccineum]|uniref:Uncharacterized protein n=1 Tax=Tanacetum coccineum TaxID=301880 RepID=A0ABQ5EWG7_9ASTR